MKKKPDHYCNHRVLAYDIDNEISFTIHEVHYENDKPVRYGISSCMVDSDSIKGLNWTLNRMKEALKRPILWAGEKFPQEFKPETSINKI